MNFWSTWCLPGRLEMPGLQSVYDDYRDRGFTVMGLATDIGGARVVEEFVRNNRITHPVAMAPDHPAVPEVPVEELFHELPAPDVQVTVVEFSDLGCQYSREFRAALEELLHSYGRTGAGGSGIQAPVGGIGPAQARRCGAGRFRVS